MSDVSRNLKISIKTLSNGVTRTRNGKFAAIPSNPSIFALEAEVKRLKKALAVAEMEREILEKATAYFAQVVL
jgi:transposase